MTTPIANKLIEARNEVDQLEAKLAGLRADAEETTILLDEYQRQIEFCENFLSKYRGQQPVKRLPAAKISAESVVHEIHEAIPVDSLPDDKDFMSTGKISAKLNTTPKTLRTWYAKQPKRIRTKKGERGTLYSLSDFRKVAQEAPSRNK